MILWGERDIRIFLFSNPNTNVDIDGWFDKICGESEKPDKIDETDRLDYEIKILPSSFSKIQDYSEICSLLKIWVLFADKI